MNFAKIPSWLNYKSLACIGLYLFQTPGNFRKTVADKDDLPIGEPDELPRICLRVLLRFFHDLVSKLEI